MLQSSKTLIFQMIALILTFYFSFLDHSKKEKNNNAYFYLIFKEIGRLKIFES